MTERDGGDQDAQPDPFRLAGQAGEGGEGVGGVGARLAGGVEVVGTGEGHQAGPLRPARRRQELLVAPAELGLGHERELHQMPPWGAAVRPA